MEISMCERCKNYWGELECAAFPDGIPSEILKDGKEHDKPTDDQEGEFVFEKD